jgi:hypothetical protein
VNFHWLSKYGLITFYALLAAAWVVMAIFDAAHRPERVKMELILAVSAGLFLVIGIMNARRSTSEEGRAQALTKTGARKRAP